MSAANSTVYVGIDPGTTGAIAAIVDNVPRVWQVNSETARSDIYDALKAIQELPGDKVVCFEKVSSMPGQGVASTFKFGKVTGIAQGMCVALGLGIQIEPTPQSWKKVVFQNAHKGLNREQQKQLAREKARMLYPCIADELKRKKDADKADAILLAEFAKMKGAGE